MNTEEKECIVVDTWEELKRQDNVNGIVIGDMRVQELLWTNCSLLQTNFLYYFYLLLLSFLWTAFRIS